MNIILKKINFSLCFIILTLYSIFGMSLQTAFADNLNIQPNAVSATQIYNKNVHSMLYITTQSKQGSGVIVGEDGTFVTCFHVIADADYINVKAQDGSVYPVNGFKYINPLSDVAILTLDAPFAKFVPININNNDVQVGEKVYTISSPHGLQFSFSDGMVNQYTDDYIQFSAPVSSGSSGGALLDANGHLIGIITSLLKQSQNINFALPNKFYISKISNQTVKNTYNLKWTDFVASNANTDQFKLYAEYAIKEKQLGLIYRYTMPFTLVPGVPPGVYALVGECALYEYFMTGQEQARNDAILLFEKSINANCNVEPSTMALAVLYPLSASKKHLGNNALTTLRIQYPYSYQQYEVFMDNVNLANQKLVDANTVLMGFVEYLFAISKF